MYTDNPLFEFMYLKYWLQFGDKKYLEKNERRETSKWKMVQLGYIIYWE